MAKTSSVKDYPLRVAKALGLLDKTGEALECKNEKGMLYLRVDGDTVPILRDADDEPVVLDCAHEALALALEYYEVLAPRALAMLLVQGERIHIPEPEDFVFVKVGEGPAQQDITPEAKEEASRVLARAMGGAA